VVFSEIGAAPTGGKTEVNSRPQGLVSGGGAYRIGDGGRGMTTPMGIENNNWLAYKGIGLEKRAPPSQNPVGGRLPRGVVLELPQRILAPWHIICSFGLFH
jgi:hypothetical protein